MFALLKLILVFIFVAFLVTLFFILAVITDVVSLFRKAKTQTRTKSNTNSTSNAYGRQSSTNYQQPAGGQPKKKIIPQDEGEYVDFEEVD